MARRIPPAILRKFDQALDLLIPIAQSASLAALADQKLVSDASRGFTMIYNYYKKEAVANNAGIEPLPKFDFLYHVSRIMLDEGSVSDSRHSYDVAGILRATNDIVFEPELPLVGACDPDVINTILDAWGSLVYVRAITGESAECAIASREGYYEDLAKRVDNLATSYKKLKSEKYKKAFATMQELYDDYRARPLEEKRPLKKEQFFVVFAFLSFVARPTTGAALVAALDLLSSTQPVYSLNKEFGMEKVHDILSAVYGFDLAAEKDLLGKYAMAKKK